MTFLDTAKLPSKAPLPGWDGRFFHSDNMTFGHYDVVAGSEIHEHQHPNEEVWYVVSGELEVTIGGETQIAGPGCVALVPPNTDHRVRVLSDARALVIDHPRRASIGGVET